jgi:hypothetical protein
MSSDDFRQSLTAAEPPAGFSLALAGLWWNAKGDWKRAHESAQQDEGFEGSWVHAYLPTYTANKEIRAMQLTGTDAQASPFAGSRWTRNGSAL